MMSSSNDGDEPEPPKLPFKRIEHALKQVIDVGVPLHVQLLKLNIQNIEKYKTEGKDLELKSEQFSAAKTVSFLRADLHELEKLNRQVREEDAELFQNHIRKATEDVVEVLSNFMELYSDSLAPFPDSDDTEIETPEEFIPLVCDLNENAVESNDIEVVAGDAQLQSQTVSVSRKKFELVEFLQKEIAEINGLIKQFSNFVFRQKDSIDTIEANVETSSNNVSVGTQNLKRAVDYKLALYPVAGAVIGAAVFGPIGLIAGLKIFGGIACSAGGGVLGYTAATKLKKQQLQVNEFEMKALTYPKKSVSQSLPDLLTDNSNKKDT